MRCGKWFLASRAVTLAVFVLILVLLGGCAAVFSPSTRVVPVASYPSGAAVWIDGEFVCATPCTVRLDSHRAHEVEVRRGERSKKWFLEPVWARGSDVALVGDITILVGLGAAGGFLIAKGAYTIFGDVRGVGVGFAAVGTVPLILDWGSGSYYAVPAIALEADLR